MPKSVHKVLSPFQSFVRSESFGGILLVATAILAFAWANSAWSDSYQAMKDLLVGIKFGGFELQKPLLLWVNDLLMAIFFLFVGLEIKRELSLGELSDRSARVLPMAAAIGGMVVPALFYLSLNASGGEGTAGWGIPMATDIAFALGIMALLGSRVPVALKVFLTALAIIDDLGAVMVIALFYTAELKVSSLLMALASLAAAVTYSRLGGRRLTIFMGIGLVVWYFMLKSGVHATVAGVLLAFTIPMRRLIDPKNLNLYVSEMFQRQDRDHHEAELAHLEKVVDKAQSPLHELEHSLQPWVAYVIMPIFALFNAGFTLDGQASLVSSVSLGTFLGLVIGKPLGILLCSYLAVRLAGATLPAGVSWKAILGTGFLAGIGFTMSLFIAALAFGADTGLDNEAKLGVLIASVVAAFIGLGLLHWALPKKSVQEG